MAMNLQRIRKAYSKPIWIVFAPWIALACMASCSSSDEAPGGGHIEHPVELGPKALPPSLSAAVPSGSVGPISTAPGNASSGAPVEGPPSETNLSPADKTIAEDCPKHAWSKNVPKRTCAKDEECGDGFCDRGRCAAIWTCRAFIGQRCESDRQCGGYLCMEGRCRSCVSNEECKRVTWVYDPKCIEDSYLPGGRECHGVVPGFGGSIEPSSPSQPPKK